MTRSTKLKPNSYDGIDLASAHEDFTETGATGMQSLGRRDNTLFDPKYATPADQYDL